MNINAGHPLEIPKLDRSHLTDVAEIFNHYVLNTTFNFHIAPLDLAQMAEKVGLGNDRYASYAVLRSDEFIGYTVLMPWKTQEAYRFTAEVSVYLRHDLIGKGFGAAALEHLEAVAHKRGLRDLIAGICTENVKSTQFFERAGYQRAAFFPAIGNKFDRELDMIYLQKRITQ